MFLYDDGRHFQIRSAAHRDYHGWQRPLGEARGLPRIRGHEEGARAARECVEGCADLKVEVPDPLRVLGRKLAATKDEVFALMKLLEKFLKEKTPELVEKNVRLQAIGRLTDLPESVSSSFTKRLRQLPEIPA